MPETQHTEYKQKVTANLEKEVVAFLNTNEGGVIYVGIDNTGKAIGLPNMDHAQLMIKGRLKNNILPSCPRLFDLVAEEYLSTPPAYPNTPAKLLSTPTKDINTSPEKKRMSIFYL